MNTAIIMAGGFGERFWPLSRQKKPKQLLELSGSGKNLLQDAIDRVDGLIDKKDIHIITSEILQKPIIDALPDFPKVNVIAEPAKRNTAPCLALGAGFIAQKYSKLGYHPNDINIAVLTADHLIDPPNKFRETVKLALDHAGASGDITTIGIKPMRAEIGYGYIEVNSAFDIDEKVKKVVAFHEKPSLNKAQEYLNLGRYYWNSGMFFFRLDSFIKNMKLHLPEIGNEIDTISNKYQGLTDKFNLGCNSGIKDLFENFPTVSIDYGLMEKASDVAVVKSQFTWDDIGSWTALERTKATDEEHNITEGESILLETNDSIVINKSKDLTVTTLGMENVTIVVTDDSIMICPKNKTQDVKKIVAELRKQNKNNLL